MSDPSIKDIAYRGLASALGGPVDIATMIMRPFGYKIPDNRVIGGSEWIGKKMQDFGIVSSARDPLKEFAASMIVPGPHDLYRAAAIAPALIGSFKGLGKIEGALKPATKFTGLQNIKINYPGSPEFVYHGTGEPFDAFSKSYLGSNTGYGDAEIGFHFADNIADADFYASKAAERLGKDRGIVEKYRLDLKKPMVVSPFESNVPEELVQDFLDNKIAAKEYAIANGFDGIIYPHGTNVDSGYTAVAFEPEQIHKVKN